MARVHHRPCRNGCMAKLRVVVSAANANADPHPHSHLITFLCTAMNSRPDTSPASPTGVGRVDQMSSWTHNGFLVLKIF